MEEDGWEEGGEEVMFRAAVEAEGEASCGAFVLQTETEEEATMKVNSNALYHLSS